MRSRCSRGPTSTSSGLAGGKLNALRSALREYYRGALAAFEDLAHPDALVILRAASDPERGRKLSTARIVSLLRKGGRQRNLEQRAGEIRAALHEPQLAASPLVAEAQAAHTVALVAVIATLNAQVTALEAELVEAFDRHPDAEILRSLPGLGDILGARVLAEFGDAPDGYVDARARRKLANKLVGILHGCLAHRTLYVADIAWGQRVVGLAA